MGNYEITAIDYILTPIVGLYIISSWISITFIVCDHKVKVPILFPKYIYENTGLNKLGTFVFVLLLIVIMPLYYILWTIEFIVHKLFFKKEKK